MTLTKLGNKDAQADGVLEWFPLRDLRAPLDVTLECTEFTCRCPVTNQPDWATIVIEYKPRSRIIESKSVKLYLETYREVGVFHEHLAAQILDDFVKVLEPYRCSVTVYFNSRGGIAISATASYPYLQGEIR